MHIISKQIIKSPLCSPTGEVVYELVGSPPVSGGAALHSLAHIHLPPGKSSAAHYHKLSEETYYILSGHASMIVNEFAFDLVPGQALYIQPGELHFISNPGPEDLHFLAICSPAWEPGDSFFPPE